MLQFLWNPDHPAAPISLFSTQLSLLHICETQTTQLLKFLFSVHSSIYYLSVKPRPPSCSNSCFQYTAQSTTYLWNPGHPAAPIPVFSTQLSILHICETQTTKLLQFLISVYSLVFYIYITHWGVFWQLCYMQKVLNNCFVQLCSPWWWASKSSTYIFHIEEFLAVLLHAENVKQLFCTTVFYLMMGQ